MQAEKCLCLLFRCFLIKFVRNLNSFKNGMWVKNVLNFSIPISPKPCVILHLSKLHLNLKGSDWLNFLWDSKCSGQYTLWQIWHAGNSLIHPASVQVRFKQTLHLLEWASQTTLLHFTQCAWFKQLLQNKWLHWVHINSFRCKDSQLEHIRFIRNWRSAILGILIDSLRVALSWALGILIVKSWAPFSSIGSILWVLECLSILSLLGIANVVPPSIIETFEQNDDTVVLVGFKLVRDAWDNCFESSKSVNDVYYFLQQLMLFLYN